MNGKRLALILGTLVVVTAALFFSVRSLTEVKAKGIAAPAHGVSLSSSNDVGAGAPSRLASSSSSSNDVGAGAPRNLQGYASAGSSSAANDVGASAPRKLPLTVTGGSAQPANIWAVIRDVGSQSSIGWRDAGAGSRDR